MVTESEKRKRIAILVVVVAVIVGIVALVVSSLQKLESTEVGIPYNNIERVLYDDVKLEGLHAGAPGFEFIIFPSVRTTVTFEDLSCINRDGVSIELDVDFQYQVSVKHLHTVVSEFEDHDSYERIVRVMASASIQEACSLFDTSQFQSERNVFQSTVLDLLKTRLDMVHCLVTDVQVNNIQRTSMYEQAIQEKEAARENIEVARQQRPNRLTQAETQLREAETEAEIIKEKAESDARILLNQANLTAQAIIHRYTVEADSFQKVQSDLGLDTEGFLSYIGVRTIISCPNPVYVGLRSPAKTSYAPP